MSEETPDATVKVEDADEHPPTGFAMKVEVDMNDPDVNALVAEGSPLEIRIDASDVVDGFNNNDGSIFAFIMDVLDLAGSSELEADVLEEIEERLGRAR
jgi:hypothetical protein